MPKPRITHTHCVERLAFVTQYKDWGFDEWSKVLGSDEASFEVIDNQRGRVYRTGGSDPCDPRYTKHVVKHPDSLMVWGCFSYRSVGKLVFLPKNIRMNQNSYSELILDELEPCMDQCQADIFMQDGASCHTPKLVINSFEFCNVKLLTPWPGNSQDLNPIENLWAFIKHQLKDRDTSSLPCLQNAIQKIWDNINKEYLQNLAHSLPKCLQMIKKSRWYPIQY